MNLIKLNFSKHPEAQDMIKIIEKDKCLSTTEAINFSINSEIYHRILETGWGSIALSLWGHDDPEREWEKMNNPCVEVDLEESKLKEVNDITKKDKIDTETAVTYFLIFTMELLGYHI